MEETGEESASAAMEPVSDNPDIHAELPASTETVEVNPMARTSSTESSHTTTGNLDSVDLLSPDVEEVDILGSGVEEGDDSSMKMKEEMLSEQVDQELDTANDVTLSGNSALAQSMEELSLDQSAVEPESELTEDQTAGAHISENDEDSAPSLAQYFAHSQDNSAAEFFDSLPPTSADDSGFIPDTSEETQVKNRGEDTANTGKLESGVGKREQVLTEIGASKEATHEEKPKVDQEIPGVPLPAVPQSTSVAATTTTEITVDTSTTTTPTTTTTTTHFPLPTTPPLPQFEQTTPPLPMAAPTDDMFSVGMDNADRSYDAWIPSEATRQVLIAKVTSAPGTFFPSAEQLTCPGLLYDDLQGDPVKDLVYRYMGDVEASKRQTLTADSVPPNDEGLRQLIKAECHRAAIDLTGRILREHGQGMGSAGQISNNTPWSLQIWFTRIALMMKLKMYSLVESELQAFGTLDKPDLYYNYYPDVYKGRKGSMVPFAFRIIHAEVPQFLGRTQETLDRLYYLHAVTTKILSNLESGLEEDGSMVELTNESRQASRELWESREIQLLYAIANCLLGIKDYIAALEAYRSLLVKDKKNKVALLTGLGRIHLQMGDIPQASAYFKQVEDQVSSSDPQGQSRVLMNRGFMALAESNFELGQDCFKQVSDIDPTNALAVNNMAVCSLYTGKLKAAIAILENLLHKDPSTTLQEGVLFNLCTLYELESSQALQKKQALLELVSKHKGNGFNIASLKM